MDKSTPKKKKIDVLAMPAVINAVAYMNTSHYDGGSVVRQLLGYIHSLEGTMECSYSRFAVDESEPRSQRISVEKTSTDELLENTEFWNSYKPFHKLILHACPHGRKQDINIHAKGGFTIWDNDVRSLAIYGQEICDNQHVLHISISSQILYNNKLIIKFANTFVSIIRQLSCCTSAYVHASPEVFDSNGRYFSEFQVASVPWKALIEHVTWTQLGQSRDNYVRGVYWGMYFGPDLAKRINHNGDFVREYRGFDHDSRIMSHSIEQYEDGGLFMMLSKDPRALFIKKWVLSLDGHVFVAAWLYKRLVQAGVMAM